MGIRESNDLKSGNKNITQVGVGGLKGLSSLSAGQRLRLSLDPKNEKGLPQKYYDTLAEMRQTNKRLDVARRQGSAETYAPSSLFRKDQSSVDLETDLGDFGASKFDDPYIVNPSPERVKDVRAENQPWYSKIVNGLAKGAVTAGATFIDGTVGLIEGTGRGISNWFDSKSETGFLDGLWQTETGKLMEGVKEWSEEAMPNYYTTEQEENPFSFDSIFSANFIGDKFLKNLGFTVGAFYSGSIWAKGLNMFNTVNNIGKSLKTSQQIQSHVGSFLSAVNEGRVEAISNAKQYVTEKTIDLQSRYNEDLNNLDSEYNQKLKELQRNLLVNLGKSLVRQNNPDGSISLRDPALIAYEQQKTILDKEFLERRKTLLNAFNAGVKLAEQDAVSIGNVDFMLNLPILWASNLVQFAGMYGKSYKTQRDIANNIKRASDGTLKNTMTKGKQMFLLVKSPLSEGTEEITQLMAYEIPKAYYQKNADFMYEATKDPEAAQEVTSLVGAIADGISSTVGDLNAWEGFLVGALTGALGMPKFRGFKNSQGNFQSPITLEGGTIGEYKEYGEEMNRTLGIVDYINGRIQDPEFQSYYRGLLQHYRFQRHMDQAVENNDKFAYEDSEMKLMFADINAFGHAGLIDLLKKMINTATENISTEEVNSIIDQTTRKIGTAEIEAQKQQVRQQLQKLYSSRNSLYNDLSLAESLDSSVQGDVAVGRSGTIELIQREIDLVSSEINRLEDIQNALDNKSKTLVGPFVDSHGNRMSTTDAKLMIETLRQAYIGAIDLYVKTMDSIDVKTGGVLSDDQLTELGYLSAMLAGWKGRTEDLAKKAKILYENILQYSKEILEGSPTTDNKSFDLRMEEEINKLGVTEESKESLRKKYAKLKKALQKQVEDLERLIKYTPLELAAYWNGLKESDRDAIYDLLDDEYFKLALQNRLSNDLLLDTDVDDAIENIKDDLHRLNQMQEARNMYGRKYAEFIIHPEKIEDEIERKELQQLRQLQREKIISLANQIKSLDFDLASTLIADAEDKESVLSALQYLIDNGSREEATLAKDLAEAVSWLNFAFNQINIMSGQTQQPQTTRYREATPSQNNTPTTPTISKELADLAKKALLEIVKNSKNIKQITNSKSNFKLVSFEGLSDDLIVDVLLIIALVSRAYENKVRLSKGLALLPEFTKEELNTMRRQLKARVGADGGVPVETLNSVAKVFLDADYPIGIPESDIAPESYNATIAEGNIDVNDVHDEVNGDTQNFDKSVHNYYIPIIPEFVIASTKKDAKKKFQPFSEVAGFETTYKYLSGAGAFRVANEGLIKPGSKLKLVVLKDYVDKIKEESWYNSSDLKYPPIFMVATIDGKDQIVGMLPSSKLEKYTGLEELLKEEFPEGEDSDNFWRKKIEKSDIVLGHTLTVSKSLVGKFEFDTKEHSIREVLLKSNNLNGASGNPANLEKAIDKLIIGVHNGSNIEVLLPDRQKAGEQMLSLQTTNPANKRGRMFALVRNNAGSLSPIALRSKSFSEFNILSNSDAFNSAIGQKLFNAFKTLIVDAIELGGTFEYLDVDGEGRDMMFLLNKGLKELRKYMYIPNDIKVRLQIPNPSTRSGEDISPKIVFYRKGTLSDKNSRVELNLSILNGGTDTALTLYNKLVSKVKNGLCPEILSLFNGGTIDNNNENLLVSLLAAQFISRIMNLSPAGNNTNKLFTPYVNISKKMLEDPATAREYLKDLVMSDILTVNMTDFNMRGSFFTTDYYEKDEPSGQLVERKAESPTGPSYGKTILAAGVSNEVATFSYNDEDGDEHQVQVYKTSDGNSSYSYVIVEDGILISNTVSDPRYKMYIQIADWEDKDPYKGFDYVPGVKYDGQWIVHYNGNEAVYDSVTLTIFDGPNDVRQFKLSLDDFDRQNLQKNIDAIADKIRERSSKLIVNGSVYVDTETGVQYLRVHSKIRHLAVRRIWDKNKPTDNYELPEDSGGIETGSRVDTIVLDIIQRFITPNMEYSRLSKSEFVQSLRDRKLEDEARKIDKLDDSVFNAITLAGETLYGELIAGGYKIEGTHIKIAHDFGNGNAVAGEIDILLSKNGKFSIYDLKTSGSSDNFGQKGNTKFLVDGVDGQNMPLITTVSNVNELKHLMLTQTEFYQLLQSAYVNVLTAEYGNVVNVDDIHIAPIITKTTVSTDKNGKKVFTLTSDIKYSIPIHLPFVGNSAEKTTPNLKKLNGILEKNGIPYRVGGMPKTSSRRTLKGTSAYIGVLPDTFDIDESTHVTIFKSKVDDNSIRIALELDEVADKLLPALVDITSENLDEVNQTFSSYGVEIVADGPLAAGEKSIVHILPGYDTVDGITPIEIKIKNKSESEKPSEEESGPYPGESVPSWGDDTTNDDDLLDDVDYDHNSPLYRTVINEQTPIVTKLQLEIEKQWLRKALPQLPIGEYFLFVDGLFLIGNTGRYAWGQLNDGIVTISNQSAKGTTYHEAFHMVFHHLLRESERQAILQEAAENTGIDDEIENEEWLAERFREYQERLENYEDSETRSLGRKILNFFKSLLAKVLHWNLALPTIRNIFRKISLGQYSDRKYLGNYTSTMYREIVELSPLRKDLSTFLNNFGISIEDVYNYDGSSLLFDTVHKVLYADSKDNLPKGAGYAIAYMMQYKPIIRTTVEAMIYAKNRTMAKGIRRAIKHGRDVQAPRLSHREYTQLDKTSYLKIIGNYINKALESLYSGEKIKDTIMSEIGLTVLTEFKDSFSEEQKLRFELLNSFIYRLYNSVHTNDSTIIDVIPEDKIKVNLNEAFLKYPKDADTVYKLSDLGFSLAGSAALSLHLPVYRENTNPLHDLDFESPYKDKETIDKKLHSVFDNIQHFRTIKNAKGTSESYLLMDRPFKMTKVADREFDLYDLNNNYLGKLINNDLTLTDGVWGKALDFFCVPGKPRTQSIVNNKVINVATTESVLSAKVMYGRPKDISDYIRATDISNEANGVKTITLLENEGKTLKKKFENANVIWCPLSLIGDLSNDSRFMVVNGLITPESWKSLRKEASLKNKKLVVTGDSNMDLLVLDIDLYLTDSDLPYIERDNQTKTRKTLQELSIDLLGHTWSTVNDETRKLLSLRGFSEERFNNKSKDFRDLALNCSLI